MLNRGEGVEAMSSRGHCESHMSPHSMTTAIHGAPSQTWAERRVGRIVLTWITELQPLVLPLLFSLKPIKMEGGRAAEGTVPVGLYVLFLCMSAD